MAKKSLFKGLNEPLMHACHKRPRTRREFIAQGFTTGMGGVFGTSMLGSMLYSGGANGQESTLTLSEDIRNRITSGGDCEISGSNKKTPFICIDLAGGANFAGSNVLVGGPGGQMDFLSTAGYSKQGLPGDMAPGVPEVAASETGTSNGDHTDTTLGLAFHSDSAFLRGILDKLSPEARANVNGAVIPARSENDTGNNPHNPTYGISIAAGRDENGELGNGAKGQLLTLVGSRSSMSGGNSLAPSQYLNLTAPPTKVDRRSDVTGLVEVGSFDGLTPQEVVSVMESVSRVSDDKIRNMNPGLGGEADGLLRNKLECTYVESAALARDYPDSSLLDILLDDDIRAIFPGADADAGTEDELNDREFQKTASVMKLVLDTPSAGFSYAGAGTITMGGYDYHGGGRSTGEVRDFRAGRCMGACLEYAHRKQTPLMLYVFSDGSLSSNGMTEDTPLGRGKGMWTSDNQQTAAAFFLVYDPLGRPVLKGATPDEQATHQQIGHMRPSGDVETSSSPAANNVNQLVQMVILNYMALHGESGDFAELFASRNLTQGLGTSETTLDRYTAFEKLPSVRDDGKVPSRA